MSVGVLAIGRRGVAAWSSFWFAPEPSATHFMLRIGIGLLTLVWAFSFGPDLWSFYGPGGVLPEPGYASHRLGLFRWVDTDAAVLGAYLVLVGSATLVLWGVAVRISAVLLFGMVVSFQLANPLVLNAGDILIRILCAFLALYALASPARALGPKIGADLGSSAAFACSAPWLRRLVQIQLSCIYVFSVIDKFHGDTWLDGTAVPRALQLVEFQRFALPDFVVSSALAGNLMTHATLALELCLPFLLWNASARRLAVTVGVGMHIAFDLPLRVGFFSWAMLLAYVSFVLPNEASAIVLRLRHLLVPLWDPSIRVRTSRR